MYTAGGTAWKLFQSVKKTMYSDGHIFCVSSNYYENGTPGRCTYYHNDKIYDILELYSNEEFKKSTEYDETGNVVHITEYELSEDGSGKSFESKETEYSDSGKLQKTTIYDKERNPKEITEYNSDGTPKKVTKKLEEGKQITYYENDGNRGSTYIYNNDNNITHRIDYYPDGKTIRTEMEFSDDGYCNTTEYDKHGNKISSEKTDLVKIPMPDGVVENSAQEWQGDCYLMSSINAIRLTTGGQEYLNSLTKKNNDGSYTVTLPGAKIVANYFLKEGVPKNKMYVNIKGEYTFTPEEIKGGVPSGELWSYSFSHTFVNGLIVFAILLVVQFLIGVSFFSLRNKVIEVLKKNDTSGINELVSQTRIRYLVFFIIVGVLLVLFLFVFIAFGGAYGGGFSDYFLPGIVALIFLEIYQFLWSLIISLLYYLGIKQKSKCCRQVSRFFMF